MRGQLTRVIDPLGKETHYEYDANGNMTMVTLDAGSGGLQRSTSYEYDGNNRLVTIVSPSGSANEMSFVYDKMGRLTQRTSFEGVTTNYTYDHRGRVTEVYDSVGTFIAYTYDSMGKVLTVEDGEGNVTSYDYDSQFRLVKVTDDEGKQVHYTYDADGRVTQVGAGSTGTFDRTVYTYNGTTGLLSQVTYHSGGSSHSANYHYDDAARVVKLTDWIDNVDGIQYEYDALGRLDTVRDYDGSELSYAYDEVGNIASMTDYHNNTINYTYTARDQLYTLTAPGSKVWTYTYNALGQPTRVDIPNGMHTEYAYDTRNRLTEIAHKDGSTVKQSFGYSLDDDGTITTITHEDGSYWDYDYDGRNRLIAADRKSASGNIVAKYAYTYDDADNMLTKTEPFEDDFDDGDYNGWSVLGMCYVERSPVRAKMTRVPWTYRWSSAAAHTGGADSSGLLDVSGWAALVGDAPWKGLLTERDDPEMVAAMRLNTHTGRPLATDSFLSKLERKLNRRLRPLPVNTIGTSEVQALQVTCIPHNRDVLASQVGT